MSEKVRVLYFVDRMLRGGIQTFIIENIKHMDKSKVQVDVLLLDDGKDYSNQEKKLTDLGCNIYKMNGVWIRKPTDYIKYIKSISEFFKTHHDYKVFHLHSSSKNFLLMKYAKKYGINTRIAHSHTIDFQTKNPLKKRVGNIFKRFLIKYSTDYFACSKVAGEWLFGNKVVESEKFKVIHNGVDVNKFTFSEENRKKIRNELNIEDDTIVIGHIGRFNTEKNHTFLIDIFDEIHKENKNWKMIFVGKGPLEEELRSKVKKLSLEENIIFMGYRENVNEILSAFDLFVFPSTFEGLGLGLIEAQANGLKCYASKGAVPAEAKASDQIVFIELDKGARFWKECIINKENERKNVYNQIIEHGYDITNTSSNLENFYYGKLV